MIELNLLPEELKKRKKRAIRIPRIPAVPIAIGVVSILIVSHLLMVLLIKSNRDLAVVLKKKWNQMQPQREKTKKITDQIKDMEKRVIVVKKLASPVVDWAQLLKGLNQAVIPRIWLSDFKLKFPKTKDKKDQRNGRPVSLDLTGYSLGRSEAATSNVAKFINSLKRMRDFSVYFDTVELEDIRSVSIDGEEGMRFKLKCRFKEDNTVTASAGKKTKKKKGAK